MKYNPNNPHDPDRDRFHLSKGHCCPALYAALALAGYYEPEGLMTLRKYGSMFQGHPDRGVPGIEVASGSLGQGLSVAVGMGLANKLDKRNSRVYCLMGDGEIQEGNIWEAAMAAAHYHIDNLCAIVDRNSLQIDGGTEEVMGVEPVADKWASFGWNVLTIDGHNFEDIINALDEAEMLKGAPTVIVANTTKGKGVSFMENVCEFHGKPLTKDQLCEALKELT